jgi:hypothetical protein
VFFSLNHRTAIADWAAKQFTTAPTEAEKTSFAIEVVEEVRGRGRGP